jgi:hypothetical protein
MTIHPARALTAMALVATLGTATASAQDARAYAGVGGLLSIQGSHRQGSGPSLPTTGADGTAVGVTADAGAFLTPRVAIGLEVSLPRRFTAVQETQYMRVFQQESRHRDVIISGLLRAVINPAQRVQLGVVGGGGVVQESTRQRRRDHEGLLPTYPPGFGPYSDEYAFTRWTAAALVGVDLAIAIAPRVAVVPQLRVHFVRRSSEPSQQGWALGLSSVVLRPAIGVRAAF